MIAVAVLIGLAAADALVSNVGLCVTEESASAAGLTEPIRIVLLSDLHSGEFGADNRQLVEKTAAQNPDLIFLTGDLVSEGDESADVAVALIRSLSAIAPVYACLGNHELAFDTARQVSTAALYAQAGAVVLDRSYADVMVRGNALRIGGLYGYCLPADDPDERPGETEFLREFTATDRTTLLLCHIPTAWMAWDALEYWDVDAVFSGHLHGGQLRLPLVGAVYAPELGWFPGRLDGAYASADGSRTLFLSRGLGGSAPAPRFHNIPEIMTITLTP